MRDKHEVFTRKTALIWVVNKRISRHILSIYFALQTFLILLFFVNTCHASEESCPVTVGDFLKRVVPLKNKEEQDLLRNESTSHIECISISSPSKVDVEYQMDMSGPSESGDNGYTIKTFFL